MGSVGQASYDQLRNEDKSVVGMDIDPARIEQNLSEGRRVVYGDMQDIELWQNIDLSSIRSVVLAIDKHETNINAAKYLRSNNYTGSIIALTIQEDEQKDLKEAGATAVCLPITQAGPN